MLKQFLIELKSRLFSLKISVASGFGDSFIMHEIERSAHQCSMSKATKLFRCGWSCNLLSSTCLIGPLSVPISSQYFSHTCRNKQRNIKCTLILIHNVNTFSSLKTIVMHDDTANTHRWPTSPN